MLIPTRPCHRCCSSNANDSNGGRKYLAEELLVETCGVVVFLWCLMSLTLNSMAMLNKHENPSSRILFFQNLIPSKLSPGWMIDSPTVGIRKAFDRDWFLCDSDSSVMILHSRF
ncbi:hypothetical protein V6N13_013563 [Hibiscus sabdariffa]|uniref:Uncharacterized protein n=2 Tax=Hibiscus sabdariffa TaxID=183260 RepID=A0ABR2P276_9ROSI